MTTDARDSESGEPGGNASGDPLVGWTGGGLESVLAPGEPVVLRADDEPDTAVGTLLEDPTPEALTSEVEDDDGHRSRHVRAFIDWVIVIAVALLVAFIVRGFVLAHFVVDGSSMDSTLTSGDRVFVNKMSYRLHDPSRGDVVVLHQISGASERDLIKRVIALPGETIQGDESCTVFIDGRALNEPYLDPEVVVEGTCDAFGPVQAGNEQVFVMGDNRNGSQDSRALGPVDYDDLVGRAFVVFWPRQHWQWL